MNFSDNKENTYYLKEIPNLVNKNSYLQKEYDNRIGFFGKKLIENPYVSDQTKLNLIEHVKPKYKPQLEFIKSSLPYVKKAQNINEKYFSDKNHLNNVGGTKKKKKTMKKRRQSKRKRQSKSKRKSKNKRKRFIQK